MPRSFRTALKATAALAPLAASLVVGVAPSASALDSSACPDAAPPTTVKLFTGSALQQAGKVWVSNLPDGVYVCFRFTSSVFEPPTVAGVLAVHSDVVDVSELLESVQQDTGACDVVVTDVDDPAQVDVSVGVTPADPSVCLAVNGSRVRVQVDPNVVNTPVELWLDGDTVATHAICGHLPPPFALNDVPVPFDGCPGSNPRKIVGRS